MLELSPAMMTKESFPPVKSRTENCSVTIGVVRLVTIIHVQFLLGPGSVAVKVPVVVVSLKDPPQASES